jgi:5S rRNA maturation endonuclease (ribonuclease M5)
MDIPKKIEPIVEIDPNQKSKDFLTGRWIDYNKVKDIIKFSKWKTYWKWTQSNWDVIVCDMKNWKGDFVWYQMRSTYEHSFWTSWNDWYFYKFSKELKNDYIFIVEWLTDYLSLRQFTCNVIWLKSSQTQLDDEIITLLDKFDKVYLLLDNDTAWNKAKDKFKEKVDKSIYEIDYTWDINDLCKELKHDLVDWIFNYSTITKKPTFQHISYKVWLEDW